MSTLATNPDPVSAMLREIDPKRMRAVVEHLSSMPNRNTNNPTLFEAAEWIAAEYRKIPGLQVELMKYTAPKGARVPVEKEVVQVVATLPGETDRRILVGGHFDSINMVDREAGLNARAPGADDDLSGVSMAMEVARVMSQRKWRHTVVFVAFSGEEQGLLGSKALAKRAREEGWKIDAVLSSDIIGSSKNLAGQSDPHHIRVFSEDPETVHRTPARVTDPNAVAQTVPEHNSRELARIIEFVTRNKVHGFNVKLIFRKDRFGRGGDHTSFNDQGFTAVRFTEMYEEYSHQHTPNDLIEYMDFDYLANVARINLLTMASLGDAGDAPTNVRVARAQSHDTPLKWQSRPGTKYVVYWRETTAPVWQHWKEVGEVDHATIEKTSKDDNVFAVGAVGGVPVEAK
jgi:Zn-dependent M28 family amino/carboxypeptidase